jgi:hypothetical protein
MGKSGRLLRNAESAKISGPIWKWRGFLGVANEMLEMADGFGVSRLKYVQMARTFEMRYCPNWKEPDKNWEIPGIFFFIVNQC